MATRVPSSNAVVMDNDAAIKQIGMAIKVQYKAQSDDSLEDVKIDRVELGEADGDVAPYTAYVTLAVGGWTWTQHIGFVLTGTYDHKTRTVTIDKKELRK